jgi:hypothetical protein
MKPPSGISERHARQVTGSKSCSAEEHAGLYLREGEGVEDALVRDGGERREGRASETRTGG